MNLPFSREEFFHVFEQYNEAVFPMQIVLNLMAIICLLLIWKKNRYSDQLISTILAGLWIWIGIVYHIGYFASINKAAYLFGSLFIVQGILFFVMGSLKKLIHFTPIWNNYTYIGSFFVVYGLVLYPLLGYFLEHRYPENPTFGLPCPTTIFTFGLLLWADPKLPKYLLIIPLLWALVGFNAALSLGVREDIMLLIAGLIGTGLIYYHSKVELAYPSLRGTLKSS